MENTSGTYHEKAKSLSGLPGIAAGLLTLAFAILVILSDQVWLGWVKQLIPNVVPNLWGLISRGHMLLFGSLVIAGSRRSGKFGFQIGKTFRFWKLLLVILTLNCGIVAGYLALSGSTPYSGNEWLLTETVWVPLVEELIWRGVVFTLLLLGLRKYYSERDSRTLAFWIGGIVFGLLHANNLFYGVPLTFVAIQVLNAMIWGVVYSFARSKTESIYPPIFLHAAMNLVVVLF